MVLYSRLQSVDVPSLIIVVFILEMVSSVSFLHISTNWAGGTSYFLTLKVFSALTSVGKPLQSQPCGKCTLYPRIRLYRATKSK